MISEEKLRGTFFRLVHFSKPSKPCEEGDREVFRKEEEREKEWRGSHRREIDEQILKA